jgi:hypothetical protein
VGTVPVGFGFISSPDGGHSPTGGHLKVVDPDFYTTRGDISLLLGDRRASCEATAVRNPGVTAWR